MSEEDGFIQAILGDPDDDTPRLVFADWLEKRGEPRAEFIRVQCALSKLTADRERAAFMSLGQKQFAADEGASIRLVRAWLLSYCCGIQHALVNCPADENLTPLQARERELLAEHELAWVGPIQGWAVPETYREMGEESERASRWRFRRGFIESVFMDPSVFLTVADHLFHLVPIQEVTFLDPQGDLSALMASHWLGNLTRMTCIDESLRDRHLGDRNIQVLAASPYLGRLVVLELYAQGVGDAGAQALATAPSLKNLAILVLGRNGISDVGAQALAGSPNLANLVHLDLGMTAISDSGVRALAASPYLTRLASLDLSLNHRISDASAEAILSSPHLTCLIGLAICGQGISEAGRQALRARFGDGLDLTF